MGKPEDASVENIRALAEQAFQRHGISGKQLASMAQASGFKLTATTLNNIRRGEYHSVPSPATLDALQWLAGLGPTPSPVATAKAPAPAEEATSMQDIVERARSLHQTSGRGLSLLAQQHGYKLTHTTVNKIRQGTYSSAADYETIRALAWLAKMDESAVLRVAGKGESDNRAEREPANLRELVQHACDRHRASGRQLALMAQQHGFRITTTTVNHIRSGTYKSKPDEQTIRALAWLAGVSDRVAFECAGRPLPGPPFADELPPGVDNLPPKARKVVIDLLRVLVSENERANGARPGHPDGRS